MATFYVPAVNLIGKGVVNEVGPYIKEAIKRHFWLQISTSKAVIFYLRL